MTRRQRGSAYLYVVVLLVVMGTLLAALLPYVTQARTTQVRRRLRLRADMTAEALVQQVIAESSVATVDPGSTRTLALNGATSEITVSSGASVVPLSNLLSGTTTVDGQIFGIRRYVPVGVGPTPYSFAVYSLTDMNWAGRLITGAAGKDGDVFSNDKIDLSVSGSVVNGNASAQKKITWPGVTVTGVTNDKAAAVEMPPVDSTTYLLEATTALTGSRVFTGGVIFGPMRNGHYEIIHVNGDVSFQGTITNQGVVFVNGNVTLTGNVTYANAAARVAIIVTGNVTINAASSQGVGILYVGGSLIVNSPDFNMTKGSIVAKQITSGPIIRATRDNFLRSSTSEGTKLCLPGYWP